MQFNPYYAAASLLVLGGLLFLSPSRSGLPVADVSAGQFWLLHYSVHMGGPAPPTTAGPAQLLLQLLQGGRRRLQVHG